jgi:predicted nucleic acid-binding protein
LLCVAILTPYSGLREFGGETVDLLDEAMAPHLQYDGALSVADCASVAVMSCQDANVYVCTSI